MIKGGMTDFPPPTASQLERYMARVDPYIPEKPCIVQLDPYNNPT